MKLLLDSIPRLLSLCMLLNVFICESDAAIVSIDNFNLLSSDVDQTGSVDIYLRDDGSLPKELAAFQLKLTLEGGDAETAFLSFDVSQNRAYLFAGSSNKPAGLISNAAKTAELGDFLLSGTKTAAGGEGLGSLQFKIPAKATKSFRLTLSLDPLDSFLADAFGQEIPFTSEGGIVTVSVPEPTAASILYAVPLICFRLRRRRATLPSDPK